MVLAGSTKPEEFKQHLLNTYELSNSTIYYYVLGVRRFLAGNPDLENLESYNNFLIKVMIKKRCSNYYSILKRFIEFAVEDKNLKRNLINGLIKPKVRNDIKVIRRPLTDAQIIEVINCLTNQKHKIIALLQHLTGARAGDIIRLKRDNIVPDEYYGRETLRLTIIGKRKKVNTTYLYDKVAQDLLMNYMMSHLNWKNYVFIEKGKMHGRRGDDTSNFKMEKMNYWQYWEDLKEALQTCGIKRQDFATHDFRRCFARKVWDKYKDINVLQQMLNHGDPKVTLTYLRQSGLQNRDHQFELQTGEDSKNIQSQQEK